MKDTFVFRGDEVMVNPGDFQDFEIHSQKCLSQGEIEGVGRWFEIKEDQDIPKTWKPIKRRSLWTLGEDFFKKANRLYSQMDYEKNSKFCGRCGGKTDLLEDGGKRCARCGFTAYPVISPAVIVALEKDGKILLGHNRAFPKGRYSVLAGFVELGESLEDCVKREIMEEVSLEVQSIEYFGSQSWPFPRSLMVGFKAKWLSGDVTPDGNEIEDARWFSPSEIPDIPKGPSIARALIEDFIERQKPGV